ncbi:hypothetical protein, partial [Klebsiella variicola]|uniref:hypothetical protein n=1 Tax=Klebsiella variicola TaxID=244366 RepID=UPI0034DF96DF
IQGFTHPLLVELGANQAWGCKVGADGRHWLCGWIVKEDGTEQEIDVKESRNAEYRLRSVIEWEAQEATRKAAVASLIKQAIERAENHDQQRELLTQSTPVTPPIEAFDEGYCDEYYPRAEREISDKIKKMHESRESQIKQAREWWSEGMKKKWSA